MLNYVNFGCSVPQNIMPTQYSRRSETVAAMRVLRLAWGIATDGHFRNQDRWCFTPNNGSPGRTWQ